MCLSPGPPHIRPSPQPRCPVPDGQTESRDILSPHDSWAMESGPESRGFSWFSLGGGLGSTQSGWLWAPNPSFGKSSTVICLIIKNLLGKMFEAEKILTIFTPLCLPKLCKLLETLCLL